MNNPVYTKPFLKCWDQIVKEIEAEPERSSEIFRLRMRELGVRERIQNLYQIKDKLSGKFVQFKPNRLQLESLDTLLNSKTGQHAILKIRQVGFSTFYCLYALDRALFDYWNTGLMAHKDNTVSEIFKIVKNSYDYFKLDWGQLYAPQEEQSNITKLSWADTKASLLVGYDFRGKTVMFLHSSETAFTDRPRLTGSLASVPDTGQKVLETTPNGRGGFFYEVWQSWRKYGDNAPYAGYFIPWFEWYPEIPEKYVPVGKVEWTEEELGLKERYHLQDYHLMWRKHKLQSDCGNDPDVFDAEYPSDDTSCFLAGAAHVVPKSTLAYQETFVRQPSHVGRLLIKDKMIEFVPDSKGDLKIFEKPKVGHSYSIGLDSSSGNGHDPSVMVVLDTASGEQVAEWSGFYEPDLLSDEAYKVAQFYNYAFLNIEANNHGLAVILALKTRYYNLYRRQEFDAITKRMKSQIGFYTTAQNKITIMDHLVGELREGSIKVRSDELLNELSTFDRVIKKTSDGKRTVTGRMEAQSGCFDDRVMALALACEMRRSRPSAGTNEPTDPTHELNNFDPITGFPIGGSFGDDFVL